MTHASNWTDGLIAEATYLVTEMKFSALATANVLNDKYGTSFSKNAIIGKMSRAGVKWPVTTRNPQVRERRAVVRLKPVPTVESAPIAPEPVELRDPVPILDVSRDGCRFECSGQAETAGFLFCNAPSAPGRPFCAEHCRIAYYTPPQKKNLKEAA